MSAEDGTPTTTAAGGVEERAARAPARREGLGEQLRTLALALLIALVIRAVVIEPFRIPSESMLPTLLVGDHLFVNKFLYGVRVPLTDWRLPGVREPRRGDVVVFSVARDGGRILPADHGRGLPREDFVKRIVALPGDRVEVRDGVLRVNGAVVPSVATGETFVDEDGRTLEVRHETQDDRRYRVLADPRAGGLEVPPVVVGEGRYFVLGDNRDHSNDSRAWGTVRLAELKGPAFVLYWSWDFEGGWLELLSPFAWWSAEKRWDRVLQPVE